MIPPLTETKNPKRDRHAENVARYAKHREERCAASLAYYAAHKDKCLARMASYAPAYRAGLKRDVFEAYGGARCACCGETLLEGLTLDHINGDGAKKRRETGSGYDLYRWLKNHGYPPGFQVLCGTCNSAKGTKDHCPHRDAWL